MSFEIGGESAEIDSEGADISHFICTVWVVKLPKKVANVFQAGGKICRLPPLTEKPDVPLLQVLQSSFL